MSRRRSRNSRNTKVSGSRFQVSSLDFEALGFWLETWNLKPGT
jgi:hypothetical protein